MKNEMAADVAVFELDAGWVCLDFANTLSSSSGEHLNTYADLVDFAAQSNLLTPDDAAWLRAEGERDQRRAEGVLVRARRVRAAIYAIFAALADGRAATDSDLATLNIELAATLQHARVLATPGEGPHYRWGFVGRNMDAPLWGISRSAADLLVAEEQRARVRQCGGQTCNWLFLDTTKNRSRQWCSMQSCGNRQKARRHYRRVRSRRDPEPA